MKKKKVLKKIKKRSGTKKVQPKSAVDNKHLSFLKKFLTSSESSHGRPEKRVKFPSPSGDHPVSFPKGILSSSENADKRPEEVISSHKNMLSEAKQYGLNDEKNAQAFYSDIVQTVETLLDKIRKKQDLNAYMPSLQCILDNLFNHLILGDTILNCLYKDLKNEYYLPSHIANMLVLSSFLGLKTGMNKSKLRDLGIAAIFCDVGFDALRDIVDSPSQLSDEEYKKVQAHVAASLEMLENVGTIKEQVIDAIAMHHERTDGSGYPNGLKGEEIVPFAKILGLVDTYAALTHKRPYREGKSAHETLKLLLASLKEGFDYSVMKLLVDKMSIFPIGTIVKLDSGETARVIGVKPGSPLRPVVKIVRDTDDQPLKNGQILDLSIATTVTINDFV